MASNVNDSYFENENYDTIQVIKLQAQIRGCLVRNKLKKLRDVYLGIFESVENNYQVLVQWSGTAPSYPHFIRHRKQSNINKLKDRETQNSTDFVSTAKEEEMKSVPETEDCAIKKVSFEIQTNVTGDSIGHGFPSGQCNKSSTDTPLDDECGESTGKVFHSDATAVQVEKEQCDTSVQQVGVGDEEHELLDQSNSSSLTEVTSLWDSQVGDCRPKTEENKDINSFSILEVRKSLAMELLWVQQAINSRKQYLRLKTQMD